LEVLTSCQPWIFPTLSAAGEPPSRTLRTAFTDVWFASPPMNSAKEADRQIDVELLARTAEGNEAAFATLYDRFAPGLFSMIVRMTQDKAEAEDVLQEGFAHIWRRAATYDATRSSPYSWAVMILRNKAIDRLRVRQRLQRTVESATVEFAHFPEADDASSRTAERHDEATHVKAALAQIPDDQRQAVELAFFGGLTHEQIAEKLATPLGTIKARIRRGLLKLRDALKEVA